ncbi:MAG TPA: prepilin-type N-terminal cleavage/methylation domain-containing protein [Planctomycetota bacterium]|nr:prepilin-type N-terminal cleavage/methylation domain-containing protein [Planctomycetota bacterium]
MDRGTKAGRRRAGLSLVEVLIASGILSVLVAIVYLVLQRSTDTYANEAVHLSLDERARETLTEIGRDLREAGSATMRTGDPPVPLVPGQPYADLRFGTISGFDPTRREAQFSNAVRYRWRSALGEIVNGQDDNGDGRADEGYVERTDPSGKVTCLCGDVKVQGLKFVFTPNKVAVTLDLERRDPKGTRVQRKAATTVDLRNGP